MASGDNLSPAMKTMGKRARLLHQPPNLWASLPGKTLKWATMCTFTPSLRLQHLNEPKPGAMMPHCQQAGAFPPLTLWHALKAISSHGHESHLKRIIFINPQAPGGKAACRWALPACMLRGISVRQGGAHGMYQPCQWLEQRPHAVLTYTLEPTRGCAQWTAGSFQGSEERNKAPIQPEHVTKAKGQWCL